MIDKDLTLKTLQASYRRRISRSESLKISQNIMIKAEKERAAVAEAEARRGIQWGEVNE